MFWQLVLATLLIGGFWWLVSNVRENLVLRDIAFGYDFLASPTGFDVSESVVEYDSTQNYYWALLVGFTNTLRVALIGIVLASIIGIGVGIGALSSNPLLSRICNAYVEIFRNIPLLVQLSMWYFVVLASLPPPNAPLNPLSNVYLSQGGVNLPWPQQPELWLAPLAGLLLGVVGAFWWFRKKTRHTQLTGEISPAWSMMLVMVVGTPVIGWLVVGAPTAFEYPENTRFGISFGATLSPEFLALLNGLTIYTAAFIAEIVRAGILSVPKGQGEAASAIGLTSGQRLRFVILPQAMRVIVPPLTNQYLNLTKNSSLAVAIGYPDLVSIATTTLNQTGRSIEAISILMLVYLTLSLSTSAFMQWFEKKSAIKEK